MATGPHVVVAASPSRNILRDVAAKVKSSSHLRAVGDQARSPIQSLSSDKTERDWEARQGAAAVSSRPLPLTGLFRGATDSSDGSSRRYHGRIVIHEPRLSSPSRDLTAAPVCCSHLVDN